MLDRPSIILKLHYIQLKYCSCVNTELTLASITFPTFLITFKIFFKWKLELG